MLVKNRCVKSFDYLYRWHYWYETYTRTWLYPSKLLAAISLLKQD